MTLHTTQTQLRLVAVALTLLAGSGAAAERDYKTDLIMVSARYVATYTRTEHQAGDRDGQFIEDVVIPAVNNVVISSGDRMTNAQFQAVLDFIVVSDSLASEEISEIAARLYLSRKTQLCASVAKLSSSRQTAVLDRVKSGLSAAGKPVSRAICK